MFEGVVSRRITRSDKDTQKCPSLVHWEVKQVVEIIREFQRVIVLVVKVLVDCDNASILYDVHAAFFELLEEQRQTEDQATN